MSVPGEEGGQDYDDILGFPGDGFNDCGVRSVWVWGGWGCVCCVNEIVRIVSMEWVLWHRCE
jgi:hypothetical protein